MRSTVLQPSGSYVLTDLDLYNWGAFGGRHNVPIDPQGTAIIGPTGSGKTTLVDALMTLLVASPRYNLASTGGHDSDRDLVSYVRGVSGAGNDSDSNEHIARPGVVTAAISARFDNGESVVRIGGMFWFDGTSSAVTDLKRRWMFCLGDTATLDDWLEAQDQGGARALKELERVSEGLKIYEAKSALMARIRDHFQVGENAFALLNRAAGLKQLDSIDRVFREHVLDDNSAFEDAGRVATDFDTLVGIRHELETARRQRDALLPIATSWADYERHSAELDKLVHLKALLPRWFARQATLRWGARQDEMLSEIASLEAESEVISAQLEKAKSEELAAHEAYIQAGGGDIDQLRESIRIQTGLVESRDRAASSYQVTAAALGLSTELTKVSLLANQQISSESKAAREKDYHERRQLAWDAGSTKKGLEEEHRRKSKDLDEIRARPGSNVEAPHQRFRHSMAMHLGLRDEDVPFIAELIAVKPEESRWRGAIERAIGGERLRILVESQYAERALNWINARDNGLRVRILEVVESNATARFMEDGYTRKLNFKSHPMREAVKRRLAEIDRHCVEDVAALRATSHSMTVEGLMSGKGHFFDKNDERPLNEGWMTGFDNRDQIAALEADVQRLRNSLNEAEAKANEAQEAAEAIQASLGLLSAIDRTVFEDIDVLGARTELSRLEGDLKRRLSPQSDAAKAKDAWEEAIRTTEALRENDRNLRVDVDKRRGEVANIARRLERLRARVGAELCDADLDASIHHFSSLDSIHLDDFEDAERKVDSDLQTSIGAVSGKRSNAEKRLGLQMKDAKNVDTGALTDAGNELQDVPAYLERLRELQEEALPEKLDAFIRYLNNSSDNGVTQLLGQISNEVNAIEDRISDLNVTLERVDFQPGRYLRLEPRRVDHQSLSALNRAQAHLRSAQLKDDQGESHYRALMDLVGQLREAAEKRKTVAALALLDPRYRLQFSVLVVDRDSGKIIEKRTSSQGGSGGEKEIIASYVLTASLSYALCPPGQDRPLFGTIVLDEAFSKSSQAVAGRIIKALAEFGLHPLFVTPNKELRLLREHTRSAIVVHRKGVQATVTSLSWEALEAHARNRSERMERMEQRDEVT